MRGTLPILAGAAFGSIVVAILLRTDSTGDPAPAATTPAQSMAASSAESTARQGELTPDGLPAMTDPQGRSEAALAMPESSEDYLAEIDTIAASLSPTEAVNFRIHAIVNLGERDMQGAFAAAMALPEHEQRRLTLLRLAARLAETDPLSAIEAIQDINAPDLEHDFLAALLDKWAVRDPARVFSYLESADQSRLPATELAFQALAASNPDRLLAIADNLRRDISRLATFAAFETLIERDAAAALTRITASTPGAHRSLLEAMAAEVYGEQDPEAAWAWATTQRDLRTRISALRGIQKVDPDMAWSIMSSQLNSTDAQARAGAREYLLNYVNAIVNSASTDDIVIGLDRLLSLNDPQVDASMQTNIQAWARSDPEAALDWSLRNLDRINADNVLTSLSAGLAQTNVDLARQTIFSLDEEHRTSWAAGVGRTLAQSDLAAARAWAFEFPGGALRDSGLNEVVRAEAQGGSVDRQLFEQFSNDRARGDAAYVAARRLACDGHTALASEISTAYITERLQLEEIERHIDGTGMSGIACLLMP